MRRCQGIKTQFYPPKSPLRDAFLAPNTILSAKKPPRRDAFLAQNTILSAPKPPAGRFSSPKYNIKTWFKALWDFFSNKCWKLNLFGIWTIQNVEQVQLVSDPILPASETFNQTFKNVNYCKHMKIYMRPWIRTLFLMTFLTSKSRFWKMF